MNSTPKSGSAWLFFLRLLLFITAVCVVAAIFVATRALHRKSGEMTAPAKDGWIAAMKDLGQIAIDPKAGFPGRSQINILCMGIDDNWTNSDVVYTRGARTDTLFLLSLDLDKKRASILSIPRDSYVPIAGTDYKDKINAAYATGGPKRSMATVNNLLGVAPDYYIIIKIDGTKKMVDALGGVDVNVEHDLNYDDDWGHLHVHLHPGFQHLTGNDAVGFARFRHGNHGLTPEDGDERRIYRQHVLVRAMVERIKSLGNMTKPDFLIDTAMSSVETDLTRTQLFDLGAIFHSIQQDDILTGQIPGTDAMTPGGMSIVNLNMDKTVLLTDWLIRGNEGSGRALTTVIVKNGTKVHGLASSAGDTIKTFGYTDVQIGNYNKPGTLAASQIIDSGVSNRKAATDVAGIVGVGAQSILHIPVKTNRYGWAPPPAITVVLGADYAAAHPVMASPPIASDDSTSAN